MKGSLGFIAVLGVMLLGVAGISHAGGYMHNSSSSGSGDMTTMERSADVKAPSSDSWQYFEATETGNFPPGAEASRGPASEGPPILWDSPHVKPTVGGLDLRNVDIGS